jgi:hypothetical protein
MPAARGRFHSDADDRCPVSVVVSPDHPVNSVATDRSRRTGSSRIRWRRTLFLRPFDVSLSLAGHGCRHLRTTVGVRPSSPDSRRRWPFRHVDPGWRSAPSGGCPPATLLSVSYDLYFWPPGAAVEPGPLVGELAEEEADGLAADERVLAFRAELLRRWPELTDMIAPWHRDLGRRQPWGRTDLADRFVVLTLPFGWRDAAALPVLAHAHGLDCYDSQAEELLRGQPESGDGPQPAGLRAGDSSSTDRPSVRGWVNEGNVVRLMEQISTYIGYSYDDLDEAALTEVISPRMCA